jgi:hypothetical protein
MRKYQLLIVLFLLQLSLIAQNNYVKDSLKVSDSQRKLNGFLTMLTDYTINEHHHFAMTGIGGAFLINNKYYFGAYGLGLISSLKGSDFITYHTMNDLQLNYAHGGLWLGIIDAPCNKLHFTFNIKIGWGALFMYNPNNIINFNEKRDQFIVVTPEFQTNLIMTNWLRADVGIGVRFLSGISVSYKDANGNLINVYNSSDFEGFIASLTFSFGSFCSKISH